MVSSSVAAIGRLARRLAMTTRGVGRIGSLLALAALAPALGLTALALGMAVPPPLAADTAAGAVGSHGADEAPPPDEAGPAAPSPTIAIRAGRLLDPASGRVTENAVILVRGERIAAVGRDLPLPAGAA